MSITSFNVLNVTSLCTTNNPTFLSHKTKKSIKSLHLRKLEPGNDLQLIVCQSTNCFSAVALFYFGILLIFVFVCRSSAPNFLRTSNTGLASSQPAARLWEQRVDWRRRISEATLMTPCIMSVDPHITCIARTYTVYIHTYILPHKLLNTVESF